MSLEEQLARLKAQHDTLLRDIRACQALSESEEQKRRWADIAGTIERAFHLLIRALSH